MIITTDSRTIIYKEEKWELSAYLWIALLREESDYDV